MTIHNVDCLSVYASMGFIPWVSVGILLDDALISNITNVTNPRSSEMMRLWSLPEDALPRERLEASLFLPAVPPLLPVHSRGRVRVKLGEDHRGPAEEDVDLVEDSHEPLWPCQDFTASSTQQICAGDC